MSTTTTLILPATRDPLPSRPQRSRMIALLEPTSTPVFQFQKAVGSAALTTCLKAWALAILAVAACKALLCLTGFLASKGFGFAKAINNSQPVDKLRRKVAFECAAMILGPGANVVVVIFWPGWWVIGAVLLLSKMMAG